MITSWWEKFALILAAIGAINWGLNSFGFNLVDTLIGSWSPPVATAIYVAIGLSGIIVLVKTFRN